MWQFVNADASHGGQLSRPRLLRSQKRNVIHDLPRAVPTVQTTNLPGNWQYSRCLAYVFFAFIPATARIPLMLIYSEPIPGHVFPYQIIFPQNNSAQNCLTQCSTFGYPAAGMEYGDECCV
jgi:hypothetical protein